MPTIKPLNKLVTKARDIRDHHRERHQPSGFGFSLADRIDYLELCHLPTWQPITPARAPSRLSGAAFGGAPRLIDNWPVI